MNGRIYPADTYQKFVDAMQQAMVSKSRDRKLNTVLAPDNQVNISNLITNTIQKINKQA